MPVINEYRCTKCGFSLPSGWGGYFYVEVDREVLDISYDCINKELKEIYAKIEKLHEIKDITEKEFKNVRRSIEDFNKEYTSKILSVIYHATSIEHIDNFLEGFSKLHEDLKRVLEDIEREIKKTSEENQYRINRYLRNIGEILSNLEHELRKKELVLKDDLNYLKSLEEKLNRSGKSYIRIACPHPGEYEYAEKILKYLPPELKKEKMGFNSYCICLDCLYQFEADLRDEKVNEWRFWYGFPTFKEGIRGTPKMKDKRICPKCGSTNVKTVFELIGQPCPRCKEGTIIEIETGIIT